MKELGRFDPDLEMFVEPKPLTPRINHLRDLRRRAEKGEFGPKPLSVPRGDNVFRLSDIEIRNYAMLQGDKELKPETPTDRVAKTGDY